jgi:hypothetical protein
MSYLQSFPFTEDVVKKYLCSRELVLSKIKLKNDNLVYPEGMINLNDDGVVSGAFSGRWYVENGCLAFYNDKDEYSFKIDSLSINKELFYSGEDSGKLDEGSKVKNILSFYQPLGESEKKVKFVISSSFDYYELTLKKLIKSLKRNKISLDDIVISVGSSPEDKKEEFMGVEINFSTYNALEYGGLIYSLENDLGDVDYIFLLQDTVEADTNFIDIVNNIDMSLGNDVILISGLNTGNMGLYEYEFLKKNEDFIMSLRNIGVEKKFKRKDNDYDKVFIKEVPFLGILNGDNSKKNNVIIERKDVYGTGTIREVIHLVDCGLYKFRSVGDIKKP